MTSYKKDNVKQRHILFQLADDRALFECLSHV